MSRAVAVLGSTGSIGTQSLEVIKELGYKVVSLAAGTRIEQLAEQIREFQPELVSVKDEAHAVLLRERLGSTKVEIMYGQVGLREAARVSSADLVVTAVVGAMGIEPTLTAIHAGKSIALANKETLVSAGEIVLEAVKQKSVSILPVDSEHSAIFQCLQDRPKREVEKLILTASGGAFRSLSRSELLHVSIGDALKHPNWAMGPKITVDSATMMNKGLEIIEAKWLFDVTPEQIDVLIHPQSVIHSMVEYVDGSILAQLGSADMRIPIQYALTYPQRSPSNWPRLSFEKMRQLDFYAPDFERFPALRLAYDALRAGGTMPCVLNAANEQAVQRFLQGAIAFHQIESLIERVMDAHTIEYHPDLMQILNVDKWARQELDAQWQKSK
jgi:1-deoxy-D-xylulose-5-phosphate reductoisomerase